jgi:uncharacterized membrane protein YgdD (TMEM256/DUF423 family)
MSPSTWFRIGAILGFLSVAAGAFGAHGLEQMFKAPGSVESPSDTKASPERRLEVFQTGAQYHMYHALALVALGLLLAHSPSAPGLAASVAGWSFLLGIALFSGSLYALGLTGLRWLGAITPFGGVAFLVGWVALALAAGSRGGAMEAGG